MEKQEVIEILNSIKDLINKGWSKEEIASLADGTSADPFGNKATHFSLFGAMYKVCLFDTEKIILIKKILTKEIVKSSEHNNMIAWNDTRKYKKTVISLLDKIIGKYSK